MKKESIKVNITPLASTLELPVHQVTVSKPPRTTDHATEFINRKARETTEIGLLMAGFEIVIRQLDILIQKGNK